MLNVYEERRDFTYPNHITQMEMMYLIILEVAGDAIKRPRVVLRKDARPRDSEGLRGELLWKREQEYYW